MQEFKSTYENPSRAIDTTFDKDLHRRIHDNQIVLESLLRIVMLCGKQGLSLRGHRDDRTNWEEYSGSQGNFLELVHFRAETDERLRKHLQYGPKNAQYTSKSIQNELISVVGDAIREEIISEVLSAQFYSIVADEVTDVANQEQLSLCVRYVSVDFIEVEQITGEALATEILNHLAKWKLPITHLRGQCYDGASNMSGARAGCKSIVMKESPKAT